ncbi:MAG TPA: hypothetical protein VFC77_00190 [Myxococcota bacterium]|nr:hypothetical protein [Myxococcota bacterium]
MPATPRNAVVAALVALAFGAGYGLAYWPHRRVEIPPRIVAGAVVPEGLATQLRSALLLDDSFERTARVNEILVPLGPEALPEVRAAYESVILDLGDIELVQLVNWWGRFDPPGAFDWARESWIGWHPAVLQATMRSWGRVDPQTAARTLLARVEDARLANSGMVGLVRGWEESGRPGLEDFLAHPEDEEKYGFAIDSLARAKVYRGGAEAAIAWAEDLPDTEDGKPTPYKQRVFKRLASVLVELDPRVAGDWAARHRGRTFGISLLLRVGVAWAEKDGAAAMDWLKGLPPDRDLPVVVQETYRKWFTVDLPAASEWIAKQPLEPWLDPAVSTFALWRTAKDPTDALAWAARVQDEKRREQTYGKVMLAWLRRDPAAAQAWLDQAELPDATRAHIAKLKELRIDKKQRAGAEPKPAAPPDGWPDPFRVAPAGQPPQG